MAEPQTADTWVGKYVVVRTRDAGVHEIGRAHV